MEKSRMRHQWCLQIGGRTGEERERNGGRVWLGTRPHKEMISRGLCGRERLSVMWAGTARMRQLWAALTVVGGARLTGAEGAGREQGKAACARRGVDVIDRRDRVKLANSKYTGGGAAQMVHVASSLRSRRSEAEDSRYDGSGVAQWKSDENALH
jgi:hypothetical protein